MAFKEYKRRPSFLEIELSSVMGKSRTQQLLSEIDGNIDWEPIESMITSRYPVGHSIYGNRAYPPLLLLKAILVQKWFGIKSDPELENQINDRISFKTFIGLPLADPSPDHSVICRFRDRVGRATMEDIHHELLQQFDSLGFSIESGMAVDARIIKSASRPVPGKKLKVLREKRKTKSQQRKKTRRSMRFQRDLDSDWTVKNNKSVFGMKEHAAIDVKSGLVLSTMVSKASEHDTNYFQYAVAKAIHGKELPPDVYADKGYCGESNRAFLTMNGIGDGIMRKNQSNAALTEYEIRRNKMISKMRYRLSSTSVLPKNIREPGKHDLPPS